MDTSVGSFKLSNSSTRSPDPGGTQYNKLLKYLPLFIGAAIVLAISIMLLLKIQDWLSQPEAKQKQVTQIISLVQPKPPEPEIEDIPEQKIEEKIETPVLDEPIPDIPDDVAVSDGPAVDADGSGAGDSFGIKGKKGGRGLLDGADPFGSYKQLMATVLTEKLNQDSSINTLEYIIQIKLWVTIDGKITKVKLVKSTGSEILDKKIIDAIPVAMSFGQHRPPGMKQAVTLKINARK